MKNKKQEQEPKHDEEALRDWIWMIIAIMLLIYLFMKL